jgi:hypothetical protein
MATATRREVIFKGIPRLPKNATVRRACGDVICPVCGRPYRLHPAYVYPGGENCANKLCDNTYVHL